LSQVASEIADANFSEIVKDSLNNFEAYIRKKID